MCAGVILIIFCNGTPTTENYTYGHTLSLHDALPISKAVSVYHSFPQCLTALANTGCRVIYGDNAIQSQFSDDGSAFSNPRLFRIYPFRDRKSTRLNSSH